MDLPVIGAHCARKDCNELDLLPIRCRCDQLFCRQHVFPDLHNCSYVENTPVEPITVDDSADRKKRETALCSLEECSKPSLESRVANSADRTGRVPAVCIQCSRSFCAEHRFPTSHSCPGSMTSVAPRNEAAKALLAKYFSSQSAESKPSSVSPTSSPALTLKTAKNEKKSEQMRKIQWMKMRQSALPGDLKTDRAPIDMSERIYVQVKLANTDAYKVFWFCKTISTGRAFDLLQQRLAVSSSNIWQLLKELPEDDQRRSSLAYDKPLSEEVEDGCKLLIVKNV
ncbi:hypothetical protein DFH11DRAFT_1851374 [Phellopilus nigrolimitatus]|nr:hypothetical protein DFH11DRAFT_1851374 [Phellopilus nigrolimitatus]